MADEWDDEETGSKYAATVVGNKEYDNDDGGVAFGRGRGYSAMDGDNSYGDTGRRGGRGGRGGCGGRGRGFGRGGARNNDFNGNTGSTSNDNAAGGDPERPVERYIPTEREDSELFGTGISAGINFKEYDNIEVNVTGDNVPRHVNSFAEAGLRDILVQNVRRSGYANPTPIQKYAIPIVMAKRDLMGCAQTGSGKTAAFLLPMLHAMLADPQDLIIESTHVSPQAVIVSPTRELAIQIYEQARKFAISSNIKVCIIYGGTATYHQRNNLMRGCHVLVATPGRMCDFMDKNYLTLEATRFMVLDEADRMLDMGFLPRMEEIMNHITMTPVGERQTLMFSATFPEEIQRLAAKFLHNYAFVAIGIVGGANADVEQIFYEVTRYKKREKLLEILKENPEQLTLVFVEMKRNADFLAIYLSESDLRATSMHGDRYQWQREEALLDFTSGRSKVMVATGVAARGLDIPGVQHVINYDLPNSIDEYVHRIGRTGRVGNHGKATSFFDGDKDGALAVPMSRILKQAGQPVPDWLGRGGGGAFRGRNTFGGEDVRGSDFGAAQNYAQNPTDDADEMW